MFYSHICLPARPHGVTMRRPTSEHSPPWKPEKSDQHHAAYLLSQDAKRPARYQEFPYIIAELARDTDRWPVCYEMLSDPTNVSRDH